MAAKKKGRKAKSKQKVARKQVRQSTRGATAKKKRGGARSKPAPARKAVKRRAPARKAPARKAAKRTAPARKTPAPPVEGLTVQESDALRTIMKTGAD